MGKVTKCVGALALASVLWGMAGVARAAESSVQFNVPLALSCVDGTFPITVKSGMTDLAGTVTLASDGKGKVTGTLTLGANTFAVTGTQAGKKGALSVSLKATGAGGTVSLSGTAKAGSFTGKIAGSVAGAKLAKKSTFTVNAAGANTLIARCVASLTINDMTGAITGTGTVSLCGSNEPVIVTGSTNLPKSAVTGKKATGSITLTGVSFTFSGKGTVLIIDDDTLEPGFTVSWKGKGRGVSAKGKGLRVIPPPSGTSAGSLSLTGAAATQFNAVAPSDIAIKIVDALPSEFSGDFVVTNNFNTYPGEVQVDLANSTITVPGLNVFDGKNTLVVTGRDSNGLVLSGTVIVWAGTRTLIVNVRNQADQLVEGASVVAMLGDDQNVKVSGTTNASGGLLLSNLPDRTILIAASGAANASGSTAGVGSAGSINVVLQSFAAPSAVDNNDFAAGNANGWALGTTTSTVITHTEAVGPTPGPGAKATDFDLQLATSGEGPRSISRTVVTKPNTVAVKLRYRFVTSEVPGGYFGTKYNDYFSVKIRSQTGGGSASESNTMNGLGLPAFDASGGTSWREVTLPLSSAGDTVQIDVTVANVGDGSFNSYVIIDNLQETNIDLEVANTYRNLLDLNRFEIKVDPPGAGSDFKIQIRRTSASSAAWFNISTNQIEENFRQRVAGTFKVRGRATIDGKEQTTQEKDLVVQFPTYDAIVSNEDVIVKTDAAWASTKAAANATTRREEGFFILLNTNVDAEEYQFTATSIGPLVTAHEGGSVVVPIPADVPADPAPNASAIYRVACFHTHTPTRFRPVGRGVSPSDQDQSVDAQNGMVGVVYDYVGDASGNSPAGHPLHSPAKRWHSGLYRRKPIP